ncbi:DNA-binding protein [Burkholderia anthina]|uniref:DNA-binding protein n=1 Tax=Burkholderia anthina TaxID=179879 RepID=UPI0037C0630B
MANPQVTKASVLKVLGNSEMTAHHIAVVLDAKQQKVQAVLDTLLYNGRLELIPKADRTFVYRRKRPTVSETPQSLPLDTSVAGPQIGPNLKSTLLGYDREIAKRVALCMAVRGR